MSTLTPLSFPEDKNAIASTVAEFPYASMHGGPQQSGQALSTDVNRMQQLESMLQEVQGRAEISEKEAYDKAYLAGEKAGMALGKKRGDQILETLQESLRDAENELAVMRQSFAEAAMDVAGFIAQQIVTETITADHDRLWQIARQAATRLPDVADLRIAVSPDDYAVFKRLLEAESSMASLSSDTNIESGTCRIISSQQDMLIDPVGAVQSCMEQLRPGLLQVSDNQSVPSDDNEH